MGNLMADDQQTTEVLAAVVRGDPGAMDKLMPRVYEELRTLAQRQFSHERKDNSLQPTLVANEAFMRLIGQRNVDWRSRAHFFAMAAVVMRRILVDHARKRGARKRAEDQWLVRLASEPEDSGSNEEFDFVALDSAMQELAKFDEQQARVVELKFFGGLTNKEAAEVLKVSEGTVKNASNAGKAWLGMRLRG